MHASRCIFKLLVATALFLGAAESVPAHVDNDEISVTPSKAVELFELEPFQMVCAAHRPIEKCFIRLTRRPVNLIKLYPGMKTESYEYLGRSLDAGDCGIIYYKTSLDMDGNVSCNLVFPDGGANSTEQLRLTVFKLSRNIDLQASNADFTFLEGQSMQFNCTALGGDPVHKETLVMEFDGIGRDVGPGFVKYSKKAEIDDQSKTLTCRTQQEGLSIQKLLTVHFNPRAQDQKGEKGVLFSASSYLVVGKRGSVSVRLEANPKPNVTWTLGGKDIVDGIRYMTTVVQEWEMTWKIELNIKKATIQDIEQTLLLHAVNLHQNVTFKVETGNAHAGFLLLLVYVAGIILLFLVLSCIISRMIHCLKSTKNSLETSKRLDSASSKEREFDPLPHQVQNEKPLNVHGHLAENPNFDVFADDPGKAMTQKYSSQCQELWKRLKLYEAELSKIKERQGNLEISASTFEPDKDELLHQRLINKSKPNLKKIRDSQIRSDYDTLSKDATENERLAVSILETDTSNLLMSSHRIRIFDSELCASIIFDDALFQEIRISCLLNFIYTCEDDELDFSLTKFYVKTVISNVNNRYVSPDEYAQTIMLSGVDRLHHVIIGVPGSGKTKYLEMLKRYLRQAMPQFWIVKLSYGICSKRLRELKGSAEDTFEFMQSALKLDSVELMLLRAMDERGQCMFIIDDFDLIEMSNLRVANQLINLHKVIVTTRRNLFESKTNAKHFHLETLTTSAKQRFINKCFNLTLPDASTLIRRLESTNKDFEDGNPLYLMMAIPIMFENIICPDELGLMDMYSEYLHKFIATKNTIEEERLKLMLYELSYNFILEEEQDMSGEKYADAAERTGFVCVKDAQIYFKHRTFAEFLLAESLWKKIKNEGSAHKTKSPPDIATFFSSELYKPVRSFMNLMAGQFEPQSRLNAVESALIEELFLSDNVMMETILKEQMFDFYEVISQLGAKFDFNSKVHFSNNQKLVPLIWIALQASELMSDNEFTATRLKLQFLKLKGASFDVKDDHGQTAHQIATCARKHKLATLLAMVANNTSLDHEQKQENLATSLNRRLRC